MAVMACGRARLGTGGWTSSGSSIAMRGGTLSSESTLLMVVGVGVGVRGGVGQSNSCCILREVGDKGGMLEEVVIVDS